MSAMRKSLAEIEAEFTEEISLERDRREALIRSAEQRAVRRQVARRHRSGSMRFVMLVLGLVATAVIVTVVMFRILYLLLA
jgi:hypothetical protein